MIDLYTWTTPNGRKASILLEERLKRRIRASVLLVHLETDLEPAIVKDLFDRRERFLVVRVQELGDPIVDASLSPTDEQPAKFFAIRSELEERLVEEVKDGILPPHVDDERELRFGERDVGKILLGTDADVCAARTFAKRLFHLKIAGLVGDPIVGRKVAGTLREGAHERTALELNGAGPLFLCELFELRLVLAVEARLAPGGLQLFVDDLERDAHPGAPLERSPEDLMP